MLFKPNIERVIKNIMHTDRGRIILSILLGLGLATIFRKYCDGRNCYHFHGPEQKELRDQIYSFDSKHSKCYAMREKSVACGSKEKTVEYATNLHS